MQGYKLNDGEYKRDKLTCDEMWNTFNWLFSSKSRNNSSYKFIFLKSIIDSLDRKDADGKISFDVLFRRFTIIAWNLVAKYRIAQKAFDETKKETYLEQEIHSLLKEYEAEYVELHAFSACEQERLVKRIKNECKKYVVGALYGDTDGYFYSFSKKEEWISINPLMEEFIKKNKGMIENLNYYKWAKFYENVNPEVSVDVGNLIDNSFARSGESVYRTILAYEFERNVKQQDERINTIELLFEAENISEEMTYISNNEVEEELYQDMGHMKEYLSDPIVLISMLKKRKGISIV
ncbi:MAG: hypothetical protein Q4D29_12015 [Lachnospiraceae bacterium]|nr:hypothetical protein [Lachnospiraceae bacterium]